MNTMDKPKESEDSSLFDCLPDEILLKIVGKLFDLKTLCLCELVSKRFYRNVLQVEAISFTNSILEDPPVYEGNITAPVAWLRSLRSACLSLKKFGRVKSLSIRLPPFNVDNDLLFKWKIKFGNKFNLFICLSPSSIYPNKESYVNENGQEQQNMEESWKSYNIALICMMYVWMSHRVLRNYIRNIPLLEEVSITDSEKRGRFSLGAGKIAEMRNCPTPPFGKFVKRFMVHVNNLHWMHLKCNYHLLELPISGYVMKGVSLILLKLNDKRDIAVNCLMNSLDKRWMLLDYINDLSIMETNKRGTISFGGGKIPEKLTWCNAPLLDLPVSRYRMKVATLVVCGMDDSFMSINLNDDMVKLWWRFSRTIGAGGSLLST
ncbi:F-box domain, Leucine-rich repeat domain, L domain-like protein [Artemisia annua]|uniref:F-box domain, Leucine-rich repeat domain, L domain-like protein n=1 Tax=Artemisia annua TaxID=35608 RepID=A0A2U1PMC5_ARTAN|nr:F-box domain, Leucine-rich repeat domain, L domain-like protein [Artemisia annua]